MSSTPFQEHEEVLASYDYTYPEELVAKVGAEPRESARLLVYDRCSTEISLTTFASLRDRIPKGSLLVCNDTKVFPARFKGTTVPGVGRVRVVRPITLTVVAIRNNEIDALASRVLRVGDRFESHGAIFTLSKDGDKVMTYHTGLRREEMRDFLEKHGETPLPPYIASQEDERVLRERYQTVFARQEGSSAAPTASLHFSAHLLEELRVSGVEVVFLTLHVGPGTFLPVLPEHLESGRLHDEWYEIPLETIEAVKGAKRRGRKVIPVGTTSLRALESAFDESGECVERVGTTSLFIRPGYQCKVADGLITNFHTPRSSLLMLVDAMLGGDGRVWRRLYTHAINAKFRLFSFGDGMLII